MPELEAAVTILTSEPIVGLDVETTMTNRKLCLVQVAGREATYLIDVLELPNLDPLGALLSSKQTTKLIHYASFKREVLSCYEFAFESVVDTQDMSCRLRSRADGHSLREICARELGAEIDKLAQAYNWARRPLSENQVKYAALATEVLLRLHEHFELLALTQEGMSP